MTKKERIALMGLTVTVQKVWRREDENFCLHQGYRISYQAEPVEPRAGWIVGFRSLQTGRVRYHGEDGTDFRADGSVAAVMVCYWPTMNPVAVPLDGFTPDGTPDNRHQRWPAKAKEQHRRDAQFFPRENGRFCKVP